MNPRQRMVGEIKEKYLLSAPKVFSAMSKIPREEFVPRGFRESAYEDRPISIGWGQTISQPYTVAFMTNLLIGGEKSSFAPPSPKRLRRPSKATEDWKVLEIGTGSGYQAAILSLLCGQVFTVEIIPELAATARETLKRLGYRNIEVRQRSGEWGWKEKSPFDAILVTAGMEWVPEELFRELKNGGVLVAPVGVGTDKVMIKYIKKGKKISKKEYGIFHFVPFVEERD